jgi:uroporphyrinogen decarboxylase
MTGKERIDLALQLKEPDRVPTFEWFVDASVGEALVGSGDAVDIVEALELDAVNIRADYTKQFTDDETFVDEWGMKKQLTGDCVPAILESPITDIAAAADYRFPDPDAPHRFKSLERAAERLGDRAAVIFNLRDGFSDLRDLLGYQEALMQPMLAPDLCIDLLDRIVDYNLALAKIAVERFSIDIIATTDDVAVATGLLFPPDKYNEVIGPAFKKAMQGYRDLGCRIIKHCDGDVMPLMDFWIECGIDCIDPVDPGAGLTLEGMKSACGDRICIKGNVDCTGALCDGTPDQVREEVRQCLKIGGKSGYIISSSNTIHQGVNPDNYRVMLETIREEG